VFRHALVQDAVAGELLPAEWRELHRVFAEALAEDPGLVPPDRVAAELAFHWYEAGDSARALPALLAAAEAAERLVAHARSRPTCWSARWPPGPDTPPDARPVGVGRLDLFESAIAAATWAGDDLVALGLADRALDVADTAVEPARAAMLHAHRGMALHNLGRDGALIAVEESLRMLPANETAARARGLDFLASILVLRGRSERALDLAEEAMRIAGRLGEVDLDVSARSTLGWARTQLGSYREALDVLQPTKLLAEGRDDRWQLARVQLNVATALNGLGEYAAAIETTYAGLDTARAAGVERALGAVLYVYLTSALTSAGRWDEADAAAVKALELDPPVTCVAAFHAVRAEIALGRGDLDAAREELTVAESLTGAPGELAPWMLLVTQQRAELALAENRLADARHTVDDALPVARERGAPWQMWALLCLAARIGNRARIGNGSAPPVHAAEVDRLRADTPVLAAYAAWFAAETGSRGWTGAVAAWDLVDHRYRAADARLKAAEQSLAAGDRPAAEELLRAAAERAAELDAKPLADEIALLARSARLDVGGAEAPAGGVPSGLTERETEVLGLVAAGRSNKEIAGELFISVKTVSVHVSNVLAKFGARTRGEAAAAAHRLGLFD
jgi:ATP/maltotriose-dependent transcriptional regulator MalT